MRNKPTVYLTIILIKLSIFANVISVSAQWNYSNSPHAFFNTGSVGIGTSYPWFARLQIQSGSFISNALRLDVGKFSMNGDSRFEIDAPGQFGGRFLIIENGNVGIGTTSPDAKLTVKGTVHAEEVRVDLNVPGPDYVFEENYNLPSLTEIETYIKENKHLPEVPSAKEMETSGINLSEMNMVLLKKIEEMTLHLIEQHDEITKLKSEIKEIKNKN